MAGVSVVPEHSYADTVIGMAQQDTADMLLLPWSETGTLADHHNGLEIDDANRFSNGAYTSFISDILERVTGHVGILIEYSPASASSKRPVISRTASGMSLQGSIFARQATGSRSHHIVLPYFGGDDDRFALRLVLQLAKNDQVTATVIQIGGWSSDSTTIGAETSASSSNAVPASSSQSDMVFFETLRDSVPEELQERVVFKQAAVNDTITDPAQMAVVSVREELNQTSNKANNIVIIGRRSIASMTELGLSEDSFGHDTRRALGPVGTAMVRPESKIYGSVLVLQAGTDTGLADYYR
jgi:hypothetical protein